MNIANGVLSDFFPTRTATVLGQFDSGSNDWLVDDLAPTWNQYGGLFAAGFTLTMTNPNASGTLMGAILATVAPMVQAVRQSCTAVASP